MTLLMRLIGWTARLLPDTRGAVVVEYLLLLTVVGLGVIVGLATLRDALINGLNTLAEIINAIVCP